MHMNKRTWIAASILALFALFSDCRAGICWMKKNSDATCGHFHGFYKSEKDCCANGGVAYSNGSPSKALFYYVYVQPPECNLCNNPCSKIMCEKNWKCIVSSTGIPGCVCKPDCTDSQKVGPVCGSDGRTYASKCILQKHACTNHRLDVEYNGPCRRNCLNVQCAKQQVCVSDKMGNSYCINTNCPSQCHRNVNQVCGTDHKVYTNICALRKASCLSGRKIAFAYLGPCEAKSSCKDVRCPKDTRCVLDVNNQPRCEYCACTTNKGGLPVCGSDGKKYRSWCHMRKYSCAIGRIIRVNPALKC